PELGPAPTARLTEQVPMDKRPKEPAPARLAATVVILRDGTQGIEAFMVVRHQQIEFASGALVFPGGKVDAADLDPAWTELVPALGPEAARVRPLAVAAAREVFEEAGLVLARRRGSTGLLDPQRAHRLVGRYRRALLKGEITFQTLLRNEELTLASELMI